MKASDPDTFDVNLTYSIAGAGSDLFIIDPYTGIIKQKDPGSLDSERDEQYNITVSVKEITQFKNLILP